MGDLHEITKILLEAHYSDSHSEIMPPVVWLVRRGDVSVTLTVIEDVDGPSYVIVSTVIALDVALSDGLYRYVNGLSRGTSIGRFYVAEASGEQSGFGAVVVEEIVHGRLLTWDNQPGMEQLLSTILTLLNINEIEAEQLRTSFGGRSLDPDVEGMLPSLISSDQG